MHAPPGPHAATHAAPTAAAAPAAVAAATPLAARWLGILMLVALLPAGLLTFVFAFASQRAFRDEQSWYLGAAVYGVLFTLWLLLAGIALAARRPGTALRVPGGIALAAAILGVLVCLPRSFGNGRASETVTFARLLLPSTLTMVLAGAGHVARARGSLTNALVLHAIAPIGLVLATAAFVLAVMRVL